MTTGFEATHGRRGRAESDVEAVGKAELFERSGVGCIHVRPAERTIGIVGADIPSAARRGRPKVSDPLGTISGMGQNNRQRRADKRRRRIRDQNKSAPSGPSSAFRPPRSTDGPWAATEGGFDLGAAVAADALSREVLHRRRTKRPGVDTQQFLRQAERHQHQAIDAALSRTVEALFGAGWTPVDLAEVGRRTTSRPVAEHLNDVGAAVTDRHPARLVHPRWRAQLVQLDAQARWATSQSPVEQWARRAGAQWRFLVESMVDLLAVLGSLPVLAPVLPPPGSITNASVSSDDTGIDAKMLRRVRALLAKAEATEFAEESEALTAKAQQLMSQYSIDRALAEATHPVQATPRVRRLWLDNPYQAAKSLLVSAVAGANHCRAVRSEEWGFVTVVGHESDLDVVELLTTSLLVQAVRSMTSAGSQINRSGVSRTRSFRQSFLVAYANRIAERLRESAQSTEAAAHTESGGTLLPVLAARSRRVEETTAELFPQLVHREISISNRDGWGAGRAAADLARFDVRREVDISERTG